MHGTEFIAKSMKHFWQKDCENTVNAKAAKMLGIFPSKKSRNLSRQKFSSIFANLVSQRLLIINTFEGLKT